MAYWWPKIQHTNVPKPDTELIPISYLEASNAMIAFDNGNQCEYEGIVEKYWDQMLRFMLRQTPSAMFMRSFFHSAKHEVRTTCIQKASEIPHQFAEILNATMVKDLPFEGIAVREFLYLDSPFKAFCGLPVARERRVLVKSDHEAMSYQIFPYWPQKAIQVFDGCPELPVGWEQKLAELNTVTEQERDILGNYAMTLYKELMFDHPNWTFDFAQTKSGTWYFIDAAVAEASWLPDEGDF